MLEKLIDSNHLLNAEYDKRMIQIEITGKKLLQKQTGTNFLKYIVSLNNNFQNFQIQ